MTPDQFVILIDALNGLWWVGVFIFIAVVIS